MKESYILQLAKSSELFNMEYDRIDAMFSASCICHIPLKGIYLKRFYPESWMRVCNDIDILVHEYDLDKVNKALCSIGYKRLYRTDKHVIYDTGRGFSLELHFTLCDWNRFDKKLCYELDKVWEHTVPISEYEYTLEDPMQYLFLISHLYRDYLYGGMKEKNIEDLKYVKRDTSMIEPAGLIEFESKLIHGDLPRKANVNHGMGYYIKRLFPNYHVIFNMYPWVKACPVLLPLGWVCRGIAMIARGRLSDLIKEIQNC